MFLVIEQLKELIKSYTVAQTVAEATGTAQDQSYAKTLLDNINQVRVNLAVQAEVVETFWGQVDVPIAGINTINNYWFSKNDRSWLFKRGIANLDAGATVSLLNQGARQRAITRDPVAWQQLFSSIQAVALGQQIPFNLPETLRFGENQALNLAIAGEATGVGTVPQGYVFIHGATVKENLEDSAIQGIKDDFIDANGNTLYLPETQLVPLIFQFPSATVGSLATDPNGASDIFTVKSDRSVLLLGVSTTTPNCKIDKLTDEGRNQTLCERIEMAGVAGTYTNPYAAYYELPFPHLLRKGDRLKGVFTQGSPMANLTTPLNTLEYLTFWGITV